MTSKSFNLFNVQDELEKIRNTMRILFELHINRIALLETKIKKMEQWINEQEMKESGERNHFRRELR